MSRVGKAPIKIPTGVKVQVKGNIFHAEGPKGKLWCTLHERITVVQEGDTLLVRRPSDSTSDKAVHGTTRAVLNNVVLGVAKGWSKELEIRGVGYRGEQKGKAVHLTLGYSHPITYTPPAGVNVKMDGNLKIVVEGADRHQVGQVAAVIRGFKPPEPYKGKGVRYVNEQVIQKEVKKT
jgi:large subunit ribosomal protein L6